MDRCVCIDERGESGVGSNLYILYSALASLINAYLVAKDNDALGVAAEVR
jgi:hypothetical protein